MAEKTFKTMIIRLKSVPCCVRCTRNKQARIPVNVSVNHDRIVPYMSTAGAHRDLKIQGRARRLSDPMKDKERPLLLKVMGRYLTCNPYKMPWNK